MDHLLAREIFIVTGAEEEETTDIFFTADIDALKLHLLYMDPIVDNDIRVLHGMLTSAKCLPPSFHGKSVFLVAIDPKSLKSGCVVESACDSPGDLAEEIEGVIEQGGPFNSFVVGIEDIFVFYGYQLSLALTINGDDLDEEVIESCKLIASDIDTVKEVVKKETEEQ
jgi:hypothetical protein